MMEITDINALSDAAIVEMIGAFIKHHRLEQNKTQAQLAEEAGINRSTLAEFEKGMRANIVTFIQLLRALGLLYILKEFQVQLKISPIQMAELEQSQRKRASAKKTGKKNRSDW